MIWWALLPGTASNTEQTDVKRRPCHRPLGSRGHHRLSHVIVARDQRNADVSSLNNKRSFDSKLLYKINLILCTAK